MTHDNMTHDSPLEALSNLEALDLSANTITSVEGIRTLSALPRLASLKLAGNPVCATVGYPACVMLVLPRLEELDGCDRAAVTSGAGAGASVGGGGAAVRESDGEGGAVSRFDTAAAAAAAAATGAATGAPPSSLVQALQAQQQTTTEQLQEKSLLVDRLQVRA